MFPERDPVLPDQGQIKGAVALNGNSSIFLSGLSIAFFNWALTAFYGGSRRSPAFIKGRICSKMAANGKRRGRI